MIIDTKETEMTGKGGTRTETAAINETEDRGQDREIVVEVSWDFNELWFLKFVTLSLQDVAAPRHFHSLTTVIHLS